MELQNIMIMIHPIPKKTRGFKITKQINANDFTVHEKNVMKVLER